MPETSFADVKHYASRYAVPVFAAVALVSCGGEGNEKMPADSTVEVCPAGYAKNRKSLINPGGALRSLAGGAKYYDVKFESVDTPREALCLGGDDGLYFSPAAEIVRGAIYAEQKRRNVQVEK